MRYKLPDGCGGLTLAGVEIAAGPDGTIEASGGATADLAPHGIVPQEIVSTVDAEPAPRAASGDRRMLR